MCSLQAPGAAAPHERHRGFPQAGREARPAAVIGKAPGAARGGLSGAASPLAQLEASRGSITPPPHCLALHGSISPRSCSCMQAPMAPLASVQSEPPLHRLCLFIARSREVA